MFTIKSEKKNYGINIPTSIEEIIPSLDALTKVIELPEHYAIVALCFKTKLFNFITASKANKDINLMVTPILAKFNSGDTNYDYLKVGYEVITNRTALELGTDAHINTVITANNIRNYITEDRDLLINLQKAINTPEVIMLGFKIIPINAISATVRHKATITDVFKIFEEHADD